MTGTEPDATNQHQPAGRPTGRLGDHHLADHHLAGHHLTDHHLAERGLAELRHLRVGDVVIAVLLLGGIVLVFTNEGELSAVVAQMAGADWAYVAAAFLVALTTAFSGGLAITGGFRDPLPYRPAVILQTACWFIGLVAASVGVAAAIVRFAQRRGLSPSTALSAGIIISVSGFAVQLTLLAVFVLVAAPTLHLSDPTTAGPPTWLLWTVAGVAVVAGIVVVVPRVRRSVTDRVSAPLADVRTNLAGIGRRPSKLARLLGGALATNLLLAVALDLSLLAYDQHVAFVTLIAVNTLTSFVNGIAPVPGGVGVAEATLVAGLTAAGVPTTEAAAAAVTYRVCSAYLPEAGGWISVLWLRRHDYL